MTRSVRSTLLLSLALSGAACSGTPEEAVPLEAEAAAPFLHERVDPEAQTLTAGFASVDMTWRAGAKPGQVGTSANTFQIARLWKEVVNLLGPALRMQSRDQMVELLDYATDFTVDHLQGRLTEIRPDRYVDVYQPGRGVHTRSYAKAMVVESNGQKVAVVRADLYLMQKTLWRKVTEMVAAQTGLKPENVLIAATHNHSAADAAFTAIGISTLAENFDPRHFVWITQKISQAILDADRARVPAKMGAIRTKLRAVQRNIIGPATASVIPPGGDTPEEVLAGYPRDYFDDDLWVLHFEEAATGKGIGAYFVFGMHPESLDDGHGMLSSDFVGLTEAGLEARWGMPVMWSPGALGDVEQDDGTNFGTDFWREDFQTLDQEAAVLVDAISPVLEDDPLPGDLVVAPRGDIKVGSKLRVFPGPPNTNFPGPTAWQVPVTEYLSPDWPVACARALTETANLMLQAVQLGDVVLLGSPSEITSDLAKHIRTRTDSVPGNLFQGYLWEGNPGWVEDEVARNFDQSELGSSDGFVMPIVLSQVNDYMGYMVTRWEFNNRTHYRQSMTLYGEDTANYVASRLEGLARELRGQVPQGEQWDEVSSLDLTLENEVYGVVADLEPVVAEFARKIPASDSRRMGRVTKAPEILATDEMGAPSVRFAWEGGSSDLDIPRVAVDRALENGVWEGVATDDSPHLWLLYTQGGQWEAVWHLVDTPAAGEYRFRVKGTYRGATAGSSSPDPVWDPEGKNASYQVVSAPFTPAGATAR